MKKKKFVGGGLILINIIFKNLCLRLPMTLKQQLSNVLTGSGELNIHTFGNHDGGTRPTFLDMAEATVAKMADRDVRAICRSQ